MNNLRYFLIFFLVILIFFQIPVISLASCEDGSKCANLSITDRPACINDLITQCNAALDEEQKKDKTLKSQLTYIDTQTKITQLKMQDTTTQIAKLEQEISDLSTRIVKLSLTLDTLTQVLLERIIQTYKYGNFSAVDLLFSSNGFSDLLTRMKYIQVAQTNDKKVLYQLQATKITYNEQKTDKEKRQAQQEKLKKDLERYQGQLSEQKKAKEDLLKITQNNESNYQSLVNRLRADQQSILQAISNIGISVGEKSRGEIIAYEGNTGCVYPPPPSGYHLHFEVYKDAKVEGGKIVDNSSGEPIQFKISNHLVNPRPYLDSGQFAKPTAGFPNNISAEFGYVKDYFLNGGFHTGLDMADPAGAPIYAADSGTAYAAGGSVCDQQMGYKSGTTLPARGRVIDHHNGFVTLYWHIL